MALLVFRRLRRSALFRDGPFQLGSLPTVDRSIGRPKYVGQQHSRYRPVDPVTRRESPSTAPLAVLARSATFARPLFFSINHALLQVPEECATSMVSSRSDDVVIVIRNDDVIASSEGEKLPYAGHAILISGRVLLVVGLTRQLAGLRDRIGRRFCAPRRCCVLATFMSR